MTVLYMVRAFGDGGRAVYDLDPQYHNLQGKMPLWEACSIYGTPLLVEVHGEWRFTQTGAAVTDPDTLQLISNLPTDWANKEIV